MTKRLLLATVDLDHGRRKDDSGNVAPAFNFATMQVRPIYNSLSPITNGYATSMARKLIELATGCAAVKRVLAHTLPHANASTRVLEKNGMMFVGEVNDPDDGRVWQWQTVLRA